MGDYEFIVEGLYEGYWKLPMLDEEILGTLSLKKGNVTFRIVIKGNTLSRWHQTFNIDGLAFNNKKEQFYISLYNLEVVKYANFGSSYYEFIFNVGDVFIKTKSDIDFSAIDHCVIRTRLLDEWVWEYIKDSYSYDLTLQINDKQNIEYKQKDPYTCFKNEESEVCLYFGTKINYPSISGFHIINRCFLNIHFNEKRDFRFASAFAERILHLFSLLWNIEYSPEYIEFRTDSNKFVYIQNSNRNIEKDNTIPSCVYTELTDFTKEEIFVILKNWIELYSKYPDALSMYFNSFSNVNLSNEQNIKNMISVIDGITERVATNGMSNDTRRKQELDCILKKCTELSHEEKNKLRTWVLRENGTELKPRFKELLSEIKYLLPNEYITQSFSMGNDEWVNQIVDIRNGLTHPREANENVSLSPIEYSKYANCLKKILHTYLMYRVNIPDRIIEKVWDFI